MTDPAMSGTGPGAACTAVTILVTNYNGAHNLQHCLPGVVRAAERSPLCNEVLVVDDKSSDGSLELLAREFPGVRVLPLAERSGFLGAANAGFRAATNRYVALLSSDMVPHEDFLARLAPHFDDPAVFAVSSVLADPDGTIEGGRSVGVFLLGNLFLLDSAKRYRPLSFLVHPAGEGAATTIFTGGNALFDREKFFQLGGFDSLFHPFYWEDTDLCYRAWKQGWKLVCEPGSVVTHHQSLGAIRKNYDRTYVRTIRSRNRLLFLWKNLRDPLYLLQHAFFLVLQLATSWATGNLRFYSSFAGALGRLGQVRERRRTGPVPVRSDREILALVNGPEAPVVPGGRPGAAR